MKWFFLIVTAFSVCFSATVFSEEHDHSSQTVEYFVHSHPISKKLQNCNFKQHYLTYGVVKPELRTIIHSYKGLLRWTVSDLQH